MAREINSQHDQRVWTTPNESGDFFTDQHGRSWHAEVEIATGHPCSPLTPDGWSAPLNVPRHYISVLRGKRQRGAARENYDIRVEYDTWIREWTESAKRWEAEAQKVAIQLKVPPAERKNGQYPADVLLAVGPRPAATLEAVKAAKQGNKYVLGLRPFDPNNPKDRELKAILFPVVESESADWSDTEPEEAVAVAVRRGPGRPKKVAVPVSDVAWAQGEE